MDIAVTGSTGFIGSALVRDLEADGHRVLRVVRPGTGATSGRSITWDPMTDAIDAAGLEGIDAVVHLAGEGIEARRWTSEQKTRIRESRTRSTALLARTFDGLTNPPGVWVSGSAIGYYGDRGADMLDETAGPGEGFLAEVCDDWETAARTEGPTRVAHIRTGIVLDAGGGALRAQLPFFKLGIGGRIGDGSQYWSWISLTDQIGAIRHVIDHEIAGPVNLTAPTPVTNTEFTRTLGKVLTRPTLLPTPRLAVNIRLGRELADALLFTSARVLPAVLTGSGFA
ncbi:MAG: TIGR01777 family oxidoreductase, partial [Acidimicrobiia bacterium]|nr:TIGR01777 family oxidoreductase [Acidimicrobiia bacterium]